MSQINIKNLSNENDDVAHKIESTPDFSATSYMVPPVGTTLQRPQNPQGGDLRFNTDTASLEYFRGDTIGWIQIEMTSPDLDGGARGIAMGGETPSSPNASATIDYFTISTLGNGQDFGDLTVARGTAGACASRTRGLCMSGYMGGYHDEIDYVTIDTTGNASGFGDLSVARANGVGGCASETKAAWGAGWTGSMSDVMDYVTIASTGNASDFGYLAASRHSVDGLSGA